MHSRWPLAGLAALLVLGVAPAAADDCPAKSMDMDAITAALNDASGCDAAMKTFEACQMGSTADIQFGDIVEKKCEAAFLSGLKTRQKRAYEDGLGRCDVKYANRQGTMWRSATAMCRAEVSQRYAHGARK